MLYSVYARKQNISLGFGVGLGHELLTLSVVVVAVVVFSAEDRTTTMSGKSPLHTIHLPVPRPKPLPLFSNGKLEVFYFNFSTTLISSLLNLNVTCKRFDLSTGFVDNLFRVPICHLLLFRFITGSHAMPSQAKLESWLPAFLPGH